MAHPQSSEPIRARPAIRERAGQPSDAVRRSPAFSARLWFPSWERGFDSRHPLHDENPVQR